MVPLAATRSGLPGGAFTHSGDSTMAQEQNHSENEEIVSLNANELDADALEDVAGGAGLEGPVIDDGSCGTFTCHVYG